MEMSSSFWVERFKLLHSVSDAMNAAQVAADALGSVNDASEVLGGRIGWIDGVTWHTGC